MSIAYPTWAAGPVDTDPGLALASDLERADPAQQFALLHRALALTPESDSGWTEGAEYAERVGHLRRHAAVELIAARLAHLDGSWESEWGTHFQHSTVSESRHLSLAIAERVRPGALMVLEAWLEHDQPDAWTADRDVHAGARVDIDRRYAFLWDLLTALP